MDEESLIREQIEYYRRRAPEYDETASPPNDPIARYARQVEQALHEFAPTGDILEIASGTGTWTKLLLEDATNVAAIDASAEMHQQSLMKLGDLPQVRYITADVLSWEPDHRYDVVFFANWLSHVPPGNFERFWRIVEAALAAEGRVFLVDETQDAWKDFELLREDFAHDPSVPIVRRPTRDGRTFHVIKMFWEPAELRRRLRELGWELTVQTAGPFFWAEGSRRKDLMP